MADLSDLYIDLYSGAVVPPAVAERARRAGLSDRVVHIEEPRAVALIQRMADRRRSEARKMERLLESVVAEAAR